MISRSLKALFLFSLFGAIAITLIGGWYTYEAAPPYPKEIVGPDGQVLSDQERILQGQMVWQKYGLMDNGSVWGHGTYRGNDYSATSLHMLGQFMRQEFGERLYQKAYDELTTEQQSSIDRSVIDEIKQNRYEASTGRLPLTTAQAAGLLALRQH